MSEKAAERRPVYIIVRSGARVAVGMARRGQRNPLRLVILGFNPTPAFSHGEYR